MKDFIEALLISALAVFAPIETILSTVFVLILADLVCGLLAAHKRGEAITSAGLRRTVTKSFVYLSAVSLGFLVEKYLISGALPVSKILAGLIGTVELKSVLESLDEINGSPLFLAMIAKLGSSNDTLKASLPPKTPPPEPPKAA